MEPPIPGATKETVLKWGTTPTQDNVLKHFWTYWELCRDNILKPEDLIGFYVPNLPGTDPALVEAVDLARRILLSLASTPGSIKDAKKTVQAQLVGVDTKLKDNRDAANDLKAKLIEEIRLVWGYEKMAPLAKPLTLFSSIQEFEDALNELPDDLRDDRSDDKFETGMDYVKTLKQFEQVEKTLANEKWRLERQLTDLNNIKLKTLLPVPAPEIFKLRKELLGKEIIPTGGLPGKILGIYDALRQTKHTRAKGQLELACIEPITTLLSGSEQEKFPGAVSSFRRSPWQPPGRACP